jgi:Flp pilus assembly protein TadD
MPDVLARLAVASACVAVAVLLALRLGDHDACRDARAALFAGTGEPARSASVVRERCRDPEEQALGAVSLTAAGRSAEAVGLARQATREAPEDFSGWAALAGALRGTDERGADLALLRAKELNPRWRVPAPAPAGASGAGP